MPPTGIHVTQLSFVCDHMGVQLQVFSFKKLSFKPVIGYPCDS